jgi:DNA adenine methylase
MFPYIGGKANHVKWLDPLFPDQGINRYVEVFGGAGWVGLKSERVTQASERIYNDFNPFIANIHECFRTKQAQLLALMETYPKSDITLYRQFQQDIFGNPNRKVTLGDVTLAAKYLYLQTQIFSGMTLKLDSHAYFCDTASNGKYRSKYEVIKDKLRTPKFTTRMAEVTQVETMDCIDLIKKYDGPDTFFYVDPPYFKKEFLYTHDFPRDKHLELADTLKNCKGKWCLSYYDFEELEQWYPRDQYYWHAQDVFRWSSTRSHKREDFKTTSRGTEIAVLNYTPNTVMVKPAKVKKSKKNVQTTPAFEELFRQEPV